MSIYVIADLHLAFSDNKPMDIFGENWYHHEIKIAESWKKKVNEDDLVVIPGDFSWSMQLENSYEDFKYLNDLPGKKLVLKGNHDYWWTTITKMRNFLKEKNFENIDYIYNNAYKYGNYIITGTRGWGIFDTENEKILNRELGRLEQSLKEGTKQTEENDKIITFMHYPPITKKSAMENSNMQFISLMKKYNVTKCFYGHLHSAAQNEAFEGKFLGIEFKLVSADYLGFNLLKIE